MMKYIREKSHHNINILSLHVAAFLDNSALTERHAWRSRRTQFAVSLWVVSVARRCGRHKRYILRRSRRRIGFDVNDTQSICYYLHVIKYLITLLLQCYPGNG
uniref:Uncharacterized protein n=1 Tax=Romanomermis culicivorax TaxID=13658 RepID=A0A915HPB4_ROMCU